MTNINLNNLIKNDHDVRVTELEKLSKSDLIKIIVYQTHTIVKLENQIKLLQQEINSLKRDSSNSSKPPSSDINNIGLKNKSLREKSNRKSGGQKGHLGNTRKQVDNPDKIVDCRPDNCSHCGHSIPENIEGTILSKRQEIDIPPIQVEVTEYRKQSVICPHCAKKTSGEYPESINSQVQFGPNIKSFVTYLNVKHKIPYDRLRKIFNHMLNTQISEGSIKNILHQCKQKSELLYHQILIGVKKEEWAGSDETGTHVNGQKWWQWVWQNTQGTFYCIHQSRGYQVVKDYFGSNYMGILIHDCWSAQNNTIAKNGHQLCHPHLIRNLNYLIETYRSSWCFGIKELLMTSQSARDRIWDNDFNPNIRNKVIVYYKEQLQYFLNQKLSEHKEIAAIQKRFRKHQDKIFHFLNYKNVPYHNNSSEQAIRNAKIHKKVSGGFRSKTGAESHAVILSIIETCKKRNLNILNSLKQIFQGNFSWSGT